jgi:hypothetical protein
MLQGDPPVGKDKNEFKGNIEYATSATQRTAKEVKVRSRADWRRATLLLLQI